jgi:hypothetical protein
VLEDVTISYGVPEPTIFVECDEAGYECGCLCFWALKAKLEVVLVDHILNPQYSQGFLEDDEHSYKWCKILDDKGVAAGEIFLDADFVQRNLEVEHEFIAIAQTREYERKVWAEA